MVPSARWNNSPIRSRRALASGRSEAPYSSIHWADAATAVDAEVRLYDNLFTDPAPDSGDKDFLECLNPDSLEIITGCKVEAGLADATAPTGFQFMRMGYFCLTTRIPLPVTSCSTAASV